MIPSIFPSHGSSFVLPFPAVTNPLHGGTFDQIYIQTLRAQPRTKQIAYVARQAQHQVVVQNQRVSAAYDAVWFDSLHFTKNGDALFFLAERRGKTLFVVNGITQGTFAQPLDIEPYNPNPDGTAQGLDVFTVIQNQIIRLRALPFSN